MVYFGLLFFFALEYIRPGSYVPALNALHLNLLVATAILIGSVLTDQVRLSETLSGPSARWILFFVGLIIVSGLTAEVKHTALDVFTRVIGYCLIFIVIRKEIYTVSRAKGVMNVLIFVHLIVVALNPDLISGDGQRHYIASGSFLGDGNDFALSLNIVIPFALFLMLDARAMVMKVFYAGVLMILVLGVVGTQSRGGMLALCGVGLYYWIKSDRKILGVIGAIVLIIFIMVSAPPEFFDRMGTMTQTGEEMEGSAQGRILAWGSAVRMALDHPLMGVGLGHFPFNYGTRYRPPGYGPTDLPWHTAHSSYFLILGELGLPGIIFLLGIIGQNILAGERVLRSMAVDEIATLSSNQNLVIALNASMVAFGIGGAFLSAAYYPHIYFLAGFVEAGREILRKSLVEVMLGQRPERSALETEKIRP